MKAIRRCLNLLMLVLLTNFVVGQNTIQYGVIQTNPANPLQITAVAYPNFTSNNVTISTALFTLLLPAGTVTTPSIPPAPGAGNFINITGQWTAQLINATNYSSVGFNPADLEGYDVYQVVLQNSPSPNTTANVPIQLFSLTLPNDCANLNVRVLINDEPIRNRIFDNLGANFNNQMSVSVNDELSIDIYTNNRPGFSQLPCPLNAGPNAVDDVATTTQNTPVNIQVIANDNFGPEGPASQNVIVVTNPTNGSAVVNINGTPNNPTDDFITYTPNLNFVGTDNFTYRICDLSGDCDLATVTVTVQNLNLPPTITQGPVTTPEDTPITFCPTIADPNIGDVLTVSLCGGPSNGTASVNPSTNCVTYVPNANYAGPDLVCVRVCDQAGLCASTNVDITVTPANDPPQISQPPVTTPEDIPVTFCPVLTDPDIAGLIGYAITSSNTIITFDTNNPSVIRSTQPISGVTGGQAIVGLDARPSNGLLYILGYNATTGAARIYTLNPATGATTAVGVSNITLPTNLTRVDIDFNPVVDLLRVTSANGGNFRLNPNTGVLVATDGNLAFAATDANSGQTPSAVAIAYTNSFAGTTSTTLFNYHSAQNILTTQIPPNDGILNTVGSSGIVVNTAMPTVGMDIYFNNSTGLNEAYLVANTGTSTADFLYSINLVTGRATEIAAIGNNLNLVEFTLAAPQPSTSGTGDNLTVSLCGPVQNGTITVDPLTDCVTFTPTLNFNGTTNVCIRVCDQAGLCDSTSVPITVTPVPDPPTISQPPVSTPQDTPTTFCPVIADPDAGDVLTVSLCGGPTNGTATVGNNNCVTYTPVNNYAGPDQLCVRVCDQTNRCDTVNVPITVVPPANLPPTISQPPVTTQNNTPVTFCPVIADPNPNDVLTLTLCGGPTNGTASIGNNNCITYVPNNNYNGQDQVCVRVCDQAGLCATTNVPITVLPPNNLPPTINQPPVSTPNNTPITFCPTITDPNPGDVLTVTNCGGPANGTAIVDNNNCVTYIPNNNYVGPDLLCLQVCDQAGLCDVTIVSITVLPPANLPPSIAQGPVTTPINTPTVFCPIILDPNIGDVLTVNLCGGPSNGTAVLGSNNCVTYTPNNNFSGSDQLCIRVCDQGGLCDTTLVPITVLPPSNLPPVITQGPVTTPTNTPVTFCPVIGDPNPGDVLTVSLCGMPTNGMAVATSANCVTYTPNSNYVGPDLLCVQVCDDGGLCSSTIVTITVLPPTNLPPTIVQGPVTTPNNTPVVFCPIVADPNPGDVLTVSLCGSPSNGFATITGNNCVNYLPNNNYVGPDQLCVRVCDQLGLCSTTNVQITVLPPANLPPTITQDPLFTPTNTPISFCPIIADPNPNDQLTVSICGGPFNGTAAVASNNCLTYTPNTNYEGSDIICVRVCDQGGLCSVTNVPITVFRRSTIEYCILQTNPLDKRVVTAVAYPNFTSTNVTISTALFTVLVPAGTELEPPIPPAPGAGSFVNITGLWVAQLINAQNYGAQGFNVADLEGYDVYQVVLQNSPSPNTIADQPIALFSFRLPNDCVGLPIRVLENDEPIQQRIFANTGANFNNQMSVSVDDRPAIDIYIDNRVGCEALQCPLNGLPVANNDSATTNQNTPVVIQILANDSFGPDGPGLGPVQIVTPPANGVAIINTNGTPNNPTDDFSEYTPNNNFVGVDTYRYRICDLTGDCDTATVTVTILAVNFPPTITQGPVTTPEDTPITFCPILFDPNVGDVLTMTICGGPTNGVATINPSTNCVTYTPAPNYNGPDLLCLQVCDQAGLCSSTNVPITVIPVNDPPMIAQPPVTTNQNVPVTFCPTLTDPDINGLLIYGLTSNNALISFNSNNPARILATQPISGILNGQTIVGMDVRPATGELFVLGYNSTNGTARLYTVNPNTGLVSPVGASSFTLPIGLPNIAFDFNPTVDRIRVTSSSGYNARLNPITGTLQQADGTLAFVTGDANFGQQPSIGAGAYTNSFAGSTTTELFNYDFIRNILTLQDPPNAGGLNTRGTTGITVNTSNPTIDMDIYYDTPRARNIAFLAANTTGSNFDNLYTIDVASGRVSNIGAIGTNVNLRKIAVAIPQPQTSGTGDVLTLSVCGGPSNGTAVIGGDNCVTYTPNPGYAGQDLLCLRVCDAGGLCSSTNVPITVIQVINCSLTFGQNIMTNCQTGTTYSVSGTVNFIAPPTTGTLTIRDLTSNAFVTFNAPFTSPLNFMINNIPADGLVHTLSATFSANTSCAVTNTTYQAPTSGQCQGSQINGLVFEDMNGNGVRNGTEPAVANVPVQLFNSGGTLINSTLTNAMGTFTFAGVAPGSYYVRFAPGTQFEFTTPKVGTNDAIDSDVTGANGAGTTATFAVGVNQVVNNVTAGVFRCAEIGETVWFDLNKNDIEDLTENGINGLQVRLFRQQPNGSFTQFATAVTGHKPGTGSDDGFFKFCVIPGTYYVQVVLPPNGLVPARPFIGGNPNRDSDITGANGPVTTNSFTVVSGQKRLDIGAGFYPMAKAGQLVWNDTNENGLRDADEPVLPGVRIEIFDLNNNKVGETFSDNQGLYSLGYLQKADYFLRFTPPADYIPTQAMVGSNPNVDNDVDHSNGQNTTRTISMEPGVEYLNIDGGFTKVRSAATWGLVTAENRGTFNDVSWQTLSEEKASHFEIEVRHESAADFTKIGEVQAFGNSATPRQYSFPDRDIEQSGIYHYRIKLVSTDGRESYSPIATARVRAEYQYSLKVFPNPAVFTTQVEISGEGNDEVTIQIFAADGRYVREVADKEIMSSGRFNKTIELNDLEAGVYVLDILIGTERYKQKLVVVKQ